jgi:hypothetical protein
MATLAPPPAPPPVGLDDNGGLQRFRLRLVQALATLITLLATAWMCTLGVMPALIALMIAKHVLVAILVMGLGVDARNGTDLGNQPNPGR